MKHGGFIFLALLILACGGTDEVTPKEPVENSKLPEILGGTDSFLVRTKKKEQVTLVGQKVKTTYASFHINREKNYKFLGPLIDRLNKNGGTLLGSVHMVMLKEPQEDSMEYFIGVPASGTKGFLKNEIYTIPCATYYTALTGKTSGQALGMHELLQKFLQENKYKYKTPIIEVWNQIMEKDMSRHEDIQLFYAVE